MPANFSWEDLLRAAAALQGLIPDAVLVGGSAAALHANHRLSRDTDFTVEGLPARFDELLSMLEDRADWTTARVRKPVLILGAFRNVETGLRQLRRKTPLETTTIPTQFGPIRVPTPEEILRVKGWLILARNQTRDYLDFLAIAQHLGRDRSLAALRDFDRFYADVYKPDAARDVSPILQLARQLADPQPEDADWMDLTAYKGLGPPWTDWEHDKAAAAALAVAILTNRMTP